MDSVTLLPDYTCRPLEREAFRAIFEQHRPQVFAHNLTFDLDAALSPAEHEHIQRLRQRLGEPYTLRLGLFHGEAVVGWHVGMQATAYRFSMINTGILPAHQGRGLYTALLPHILALVQAEGFQQVYSRHIATNNQVLVPKLKAGFVITGFEIDDLHGLLVHLSYFFNPIRRRVLDFRAGQAHPDEEVRRYLHL